MPFLESEDEMLKILATLTIANIVDEEENKTLITDTGIRNRPLIAYVVCVLIKMPHIGNTAQFKEQTDLGLQCLLGPICTQCDIFKI